MDEIRYNKAELSTEPAQTTFETFTCANNNIRTVLLPVGILGLDDDKAEESGGGDDNKGDEILAELRKKQAELRALSHQNTMMLRHLHKNAKDELLNQDLRRKMAAADAEVFKAVFC